MRNFSKQRFGLMGKLHNGITDLIDSSLLTPPEVLLVLDTLSVSIRNLVIAKSNATNRKPTRRKPNGNNVA